MQKEHWYFLIEGKQNMTKGVIGNFYAYGDHLGEAFRNALEAAGKNGFISPHGLEAERLDDNDEFQMPVDCVELDAKVSMRPSLHFYKLGEDEHLFLAPIGIIKGTKDDEFDYELIKENFVAYSRNENGLFEFKLVVSQYRLTDVFLKAIDFLPEVNGCWIYIRDYWDNGETELWASGKITGKEAIVTFFTDNKLSTIENGYVDCVVHSLIGETNLTLDEHKTIQLHTRDENVFNDFIAAIMNLGFEQTYDLYELEFGYHHWHYRPAGSLNRREFVDFLKTEGFERLERAR